MNAPDNERIELTPKQKKAQRARNLAIALSLATFVIILYVATWSKLGSNLFNRPL